MRSDAVRRLGLAVMGATLLVAPACETVDEQLFDEIGVTRIFLTHTSLRGQQLGGEERIQVAEWEIAAASLDIGGQVVDLLNGEPCRFVQVLGVPLAFGRCAGGRILESNAVAQPAMLELVLAEMRLRRAPPTFLPAGADFDMDGVTNEVDDCPLVADPGQEDDDMDGFGDACSVIDPITLTPLLDSDADGVVDLFDNCIAVPNPDQADSSVTTEGFTDLIGDACPEQIARVHKDGDFTIRLELGVDLLQLQGQVAFVTVDFGQTRNCPWDFGVCPVGQPRICIRNSVLGATLGCP